MKKTKKFRILQYKVHMTIGIQVHYRVERKITLWRWEWWVEAQYRLDDELASTMEPYKFGTYQCALDYIDSLSFHPIIVNYL